MSTHTQSESPELVSVAQKICRSQRTVVLTGAGISAESGIPTFRDSLTGLWEQFDPLELATPEAYCRNPSLVWGWYEWRRMKVLQSPPNPGHLALATLAAQVPQLILITQNVDDLHERAGSPAVLHLHGSLHHPRCFECHHPHTLAPGMPEEPEGGRTVPPPRCSQCCGPVRPGVVWFGESLPSLAWQQAMAAVHHCDLLISIGTSGLVYPAASLPEIAHKNNTPIIVINPAPTEQDNIATHIFRGRAGEILPQLLKLIPHHHRSRSM